MTKLEREFSRDPSEYEATGHLKQRIRNGGDRKVLDFEIIAEAIEEGEVIEVKKNYDKNGNRSGREVNLRYTWLQTTLRVGLVPEDRVVKTAWEVES